MTSITIGILMGCLIFCWYVIYDISKKRNREQKTFNELAKERSDLKCELESEKLENRHLMLNLEQKRKKLKEVEDVTIKLCQREDKLITQWAKDNCGHAALLNLWPASVVDKYMVFEIEGVMIKNHTGTARELWELYNSEKEVYTKHSEAKAELKKRVEEALDYKELANCEPVEHVVEDVYIKGEITEAE